MEPSAGPLRKNGQERQSGVEGATTKRPWGGLQRTLMAVAAAGTGMLAAALEQTASVDAVKAYARALERDPANRTAFQVLQKRSRRTDPLDKRPVLC